MAKLGRAGLHVRPVDVGWIAQDQVVPCLAQPGKKIRLHGLHAVRDAVMVDVDAGHGQRVVGNVHGIDLGPGKSQCRCDRDAAAAGPEIDDAPDFVPGDPRLEPGLDQFGKRRPRHEDTLVDIKAQPAEPGLVEQVGQRHSLLDPADREGAYPCRGLVVEDIAVNPLRLVVRQPGRPEYEPRRLVPRVIGSVSEIEAGTLEAGLDFQD